MIDFFTVAGGAGAVLMASAWCGWQRPRKPPRDMIGQPLPGLPQPIPKTQETTVATTAPGAGLERGGRSRYLLLDPATAADRFLDWLKKAGIKTATAAEAWTLYGEHCLAEDLEQLPQNVVMAEVKKRCWSGQKRMNGERPTVYAFDRPPAPLPTAARRPPPGHVYQLKRVAKAA